MKYIILIIIILHVISCSDLTSEKRFEQTSLVITGLLYEGQPISPDAPIFVGRTIDVEGGNLLDLIITDAQVRFINITEPDTIMLRFVPEELGKNKEVGKIGYIDPNWENENAMIITSEHTYRIEATALHNGEYVTLSAETIVPESITLNPTDDPAFSFDESDNPELSYEIANSEHPLRIQTYSEDTIDLFFRFYCLESFENAYYIIEFPGLGDTPDDEEEYEHPVTGMPRKMEFWWAYQPTWNDEFGMYLVTDRGYKASFIFYGSYEIEILSIDSNYFQYLYKPNGFMHGGVENGYGYFGSASGGKLYTKVVE